MKETTPDKPKPRDGIWSCDGLEAEFRLILEPEHGNGMVRVETASGEHWAPNQELKWDTK